MSTATSTSFMSFDGGKLYVPPEVKKLTVNKDTGETIMHKVARLGKEVTLTTRIDLCPFPLIACTLIISLIWYGTMQLKNNTCFYITGKLYTSARYEYVTCSLINDKL